MHSSIEDIYFMKNRIAAVLAAVITVLLLLPLSGCSKYSSSYNAVAFVHTNTAQNASMSFSSFKGTIVFKLKCRGENEKINYSAKLANGSAKVFYDSNGVKTELFSINSGDEISDIGGVLQQGTVYIIVEMPETGNDGRFVFSVK